MNAAQPKVQLVLPYPISANRYWAHRVIPAKNGKPAMAITYVTAEAKAFKQQVALIARASGIREPIEGRVRLSLQLYPHRPLDWKTRMRKLGEFWDDDVQCIDLGNAEKVLSDALQGAVISDDKRFRRILLDRMEPDDKPARVEITVERLLPSLQQVAIAMPDQPMELPF